MELEERGFYQNVKVANNFPISGCPTAQDISLPLIPDRYRIRGLEVVLSGSPMDAILLFGEREQEEKGRKALISEYNVDRQCWTDRHTAEQS